MSTGRRAGRVLWFNQIQGIGMADGGGQRVRVHYRDIIAEGGYRALDAGDAISFVVEASEAGAIARQVRLEDSLPRE